MNQILSMQSDFNDYNNKSTKKQPREVPNKASIKSIVTFFSILIILFGLILIGDSVYAIISSKPKLKDNPNITIQAVGLEATIKVSTEKPIKQISYRWNQDNETILQGDGTVQMEATVDIPDGNNILNISVIDFYGNKTDYQKQYVSNRNDKTKPTIEITVSGNTLNIVANDETELAYLTYRME